MTLALGFAAMLIGADLILSGYTGKPIAALLLGKWDTGTIQPPQTSAKGTANAGGVYAPGKPLSSFAAQPATGKGQALSTFLPK